MIRFFAFVALITGVFLVTQPARAQQEAPGHSHAPGQEHDHSKEARPLGAGEDNYTFFLRKSDEAFHAGDYDRAVACHRAIIALEPDVVESYSVAAWLLWSSEKGDEAIAFIERGIAANPNNWEMMDEAAQHFDLRKMNARSAALYKRALELLPKDEPSQMLKRRYAHAAEKSGDLQTSVTVWRGLVQEFPDEAVNKNNLARVEQLVANKQK
jgi:tetratricopeptide (TPR) repeat protein